MGDQVAGEERFVIETATRTAVRPLIGFYGRSGSGKTLSALYYARGIVGPAGKIGLLDTENRRGSIYADLVPGGYQVVNLRAPFSPHRYAAAFETLEKLVDIIVVDSMSHEWSGEGGVLDMQEAELDRMAGQDYRKRESCKMASWIKPKMEHKKLIGRILRCNVPLLCCLRGEEKTHMERGKDGKNTVVTDQFSSPLFDPRFIFEMLVNFETITNAEGVGGFVIPRKITHPDVARLLPAKDQQISISHGQALAAWCANPSGKAPEPAPGTPEAAAAINAKREKLLKALEVYGEPMLKAFCEQRGWLAPMDELTLWPISHIPKTTGELRELMRQIEEFRESTKGK